MADGSATRELMGWDREQSVKELMAMDAPYMEREVRDLEGAERSVTVRMHSGTQRRAHPACWQRPEEGADRGEGLASPETVHGLLRVRRASSLGSDRLARCSATLGRGHPC